MRVIQIILAAALCATGMIASAHAAPPRTFEIQVQSVDPAGGTLEVSAWPDSGKRWKVTLKPDTVLTMDRELPRGALPLGKPLWVRGDLMEAGARRGARKVDNRSLVVKEVIVPPPGAAKPPQGMMEAAFEERAGGKIIAIVGGAEAVYLRGTPENFRHPVIWSPDEPMTRKMIEPGLTGEIVAEETPGGLVAKKLHLKVQHKPYGTYMTDLDSHDPAEPVEEIRKSVAAVKATHAPIAAELDKLAPVDMRVSPALLKLGEKPRLTIRAITDRRPAAGVVVHENYLKEGIGAGTTLPLDWKKGKDGSGRTVYTVSLNLPAGKPGQYLVHWKCDIGGDITDYRRSYAVVENGWTVALLNDVGTEKGADRKLFLENFLPHTYWMGQHLNLTWLRTQKTAVQWAAISRPAREFGIEPQLFLFNSEWARKGGSINFDGNREEYIREVLRAYKELWPLYRYPVDCENAGTYAYSTAFTRALMAEGYKSKVSVCPFHTLEHHPGQLINTTAIGHFPHYISQEDFRKTGNESGRSPVSIGQMTGNYLRNRTGSECWDCTEPNWVTLEWNNQAGPRGNYIPGFYSRMFHQTDTLLANARNHPDSPHFYIAGFEAFANPWAQPGHNFLVGDLVGRARAGKPVVFATGNAITDYLLRHFRQSPRNIHYYHDYLAGVTQKGSPLELPDSIDIEDADFRAVFGRPEIFPLFHYDFTRKWNEPDFGNDDAIRPYWWTKMAGAGLESRYDLTPKPEDWRDLKTSRTETPGKTHRITLNVESPREAQCVPLALWDIPREWRPGKDWFKTRNVREFIPVVAPQTDNLNGVLVVDLKKGMNTFTVEIITPAREPKTMDITFADSVRAKTWTRGTHDGRPVTYLWPLNPWGAEVTVTIPEGKTATAYLTPDTKEQELTAGVYKFNLRFQQWLRLIGLTQAEINQSVNVK